jgi:proteic killer suppression protein
VHLAGFRHKGLKYLYEDEKAKSVPPAMIDKLRKLLLALETSESLEQLNRFPGWKLHPLKGHLKGLWSHRYRKLAVNFPLRRSNEYR